MRSAVVRSFQVCKQYTRVRYSENYVRYFLSIPGIHKHILMPIAGAAIGYQINEWKEEALAERDAQKRHYIELHPDDFPQPGELLSQLQQGDL